MKSKIAVGGVDSVTVVLERGVAGPNSLPNAFDDGMQVVRCSAEQYWLRNHNAAEGLDSS